MKKLNALIIRTVFIILLCLTGAVIPAGAQEAAYCSDETQLQEVFAKAQQEAADNIRFQCSADLFSRILDKDSLILAKAEYNNNIISATVNYYNSGLFEISDIRYQDIFCRECQTREDVQTVLTEYVREGRHPAQIVLFTDADLFAQLMENGLLFACASQAGLKEFNISYIEPKHIFFLNDISLKPEEEMAQDIITDENSLRDAINAHAADAEFSFQLSTDFYSALMDNEKELLKTVLKTSHLDKYNLYTNDYKCTLAFSDASFFDGNLYSCNSAEELSQVFQNVRSEKNADPKDLRIVLDEETYRFLTQDDMSALHELEGRAGLLAGSRLYYNDTDFILTYESPEFAENIVSLETPEETVEFFAGLAMDADPHQSIHCSPSLYQFLLSDEEGNPVENSGLCRLFDLLAACGVFDVQYSYDNTRNLITIENCIHSPGTRIAYAVENNCKQILSETELKVLEAAEDIAEAAKEQSDGDPLRTARYIHDSLCGRIKYTIDENSNEDDTAIGALLNGEANCTGYSDAFYLTGSLAGLEIAFQHGDSLEDKDPAFKESSHVWNLMRSDGSWSMVDVTWDDNDPPGAEYTWFNIGQDRASRTHKWNRDTSVPILPETDPASRPENESTVYSIDEAIAAAQSAVQNLSDFFIYFADEDAAKDYADVLEYVRTHITGSFYYSWNEHMLMLNVYMN